MRCLGGKGLWALAAAVALSGCIPSTHPPERLYPVAYEMDLIRASQGDLVGQYNAAFLSSPAQAKLIRNEIIAQRMYAIDVQYTLYENALTRETQEIGFGALTTAEGLSTAATLVTPAATKTILSAAATGVLAVKGHYDSEVLLAQSMRTIQKQMRSSRNMIAAGISAKLVQPVSEYPLTAALSDLEEYYAAGTVTSGVIDTSTTVGIKENDTKNIKQDVTQAAPAARAAVLRDATAPIVMPAVVIPPRVDTGGAPVVRVTPAAPAPANVAPRPSSNVPAAKPNTNVAALPPSTTGPGAVLARPCNQVPPDEAARVLLTYLCPTEKGINRSHREALEKLMPEVKGRVLTVLIEATPAQAALRAKLLTRFNDAAKQGQAPAPAPAPAIAARPCDQVPPDEAAEVLLSFLCPTEKGINTSRREALEKLMPEVKGRVLTVLIEATPAQAALRAKLLARFNDAAKQGQAPGGAVVARPCNQTPPDEAAQALLSYLCPTERGINGSHRDALESLMPEVKGRVLTVLTEATPAQAELRANLLNRFNDASRQGKLPQ
jgi:hypothetical protein